MTYIYRLCRSVLLAVGVVSLLTNVARAETPADQLVIGVTMNNILSLDPPFQSGRESLEVLANVYDTMLQMDPEERGTLVPGLATNWEVSDDGTKINLTMREDATFHSGNPITAHDFVWSLQRSLDLEATQASNWKIHGFNAENLPTHVVATGDYSIEITLPQTTDPKLILYLLSRNAASMVLDRVLVEENAVDGDMGQAWLATNDAGSGAFTLQNWQPSNLIILERFDGFWGKTADMRRVVYRHMPEPQTQRLALQNADIDIAMNLAVADIRALANDPEIRIQSSPGGNIYYLAVNMKHEKYANNKVREALRYLIDYEGVNGTIMPYYGELHQRNMQSGLAASLPNPGYTLDPDKAKALLTEAGYPDGLDATIRVLAEPPFLDAATAIQATLALGGIRAEIISGNGDAVYGKMRERDFDMIVGRGGGGGEPHPHSNLQSQFYNPDNRDEAKLTSFQGWRTSFYNEKLNGMIDEALLETDTETQIGMYHAIQEFVDKEFPASLTPFSQVTDTVLMRNDIEGYIYHFAWTTRLNEVSKNR